MNSENHKQTERGYEIVVTTFNARGTRRNITELEQFARETKPDVINVQESLTSKEIGITGYNCITRKSPDERGQAIYIKRKLVYNITDAEKYKKAGMEVMSIEIKLKHRKCLNIVNLYCKDKALDHTVLTEILKQYRNCIIIGDLNAKMDIPLHETTNENGTKLQAAFEDGLLKPVLPEGYTRYDPGNRNPSCIDFLVTKPKTQFAITSVKIGDDLGSDHRPVTYNLLTHGGVMTQGPKSPKPNFKKADWEKYQTSIDEQLPTLPQISATKCSIDEAILKFTNMVTKADKESVPRKKPGLPSKPPLPQRIVSLINEKRKLRNLIQNRRLDNYTICAMKNKVHSLKHQIDKEIKILERERLDEIWMETENKTPYGFYEMAKRMSGESKKTDSTYPITDPNGHPILDDDEKAETFRALYEDIYCVPDPSPEHFDIHEQAKDFADTIREHFGDIQARNEDAFDINTTVTPDDIQKVLRQTKLSAPGPDGIYYRHIKQLPERALEYLAGIFSTTIKCAYIPDQWKSGTTILIPKPGKNPKSAINYRPITLLSTIGKSLERVINERLKEKIEQNNLLPESQAGFRPRRSTQDQLLRLVQHISSGFQRGNVTLACFHDIEKAFDKMWPDGLLYKMKNVSNLKPGTIALVASFLQNRKVKFKVNQAISKPLTLKAGTPQGAILSPTIFNLWVGDIPQPGNISHLSQYADDIAVWASGRSVETSRAKIQTYNTALTNWCHKWKILLSPMKTQLVCFSRKPPQSLACAYQFIGNTRVEAIPEAKFLGITLDGRLKFRTHQKETIQKMTTKVAKFSTVTGSPKYPRASEETGIRILKSMIAPISGYANTIAAMFPPTYFENLDRILARGARKALHLPKTISREYVVERTNLVSSREKTLRDAKNYLLNDQRSESVKALIANRKTNAKMRKTFKTPLDMILK